MIVAAFQQVFPEVRGAYEKIRFKGLAFESAHLYGEEAPEYFTVLENGVHYQVFMNDGLMTGIFWISMRYVVPWWMAWRQASHFEHVLVYGSIFYCCCHGRSRGNDFC